jgi:hypothetical protein
MHLRISGTDDKHARRTFQPHVLDICKRDQGFRDMNAFLALVTAICVFLQHLEQPTGSKIGCHSNTSSMFIILQALDNQNAVG